MRWSSVVVDVVGHGVAGISRASRGGLRRGCRPRSRARRRRRTALAVSTPPRDGALRRDRAVARRDVGMEHLEQRDQAMARSSGCDPVERPALRGALMDGSRSGACRRRGERARERRRVPVDQVVEPAAGHVLLVQGEDRCAPRSCRRDMVVAGRRGSAGRAQARAEHAERVDLDGAARRRRTAGPGSWRRSRAWRASCRRRGGVAAQPRLGLVTSSSTEPAAAGRRAGRR